MTKLTLAIFSALAIAATGCGDAGTMGTGGTGGTGGSGGTPFAPSLMHTFPPIDVEVGGEIANLCQRWTLNNDEPLYVTRLRSTNEGGWHHSNWTFAPERAFLPEAPYEDPESDPDGTFTCWQRNYDQVSSAISGGVIFAQSTQALEELQAFPEGSAVVIPPRSAIFGGIHLLNVSAEAISSSLTMEIETKPAAEIDIPLSPVSFLIGSIRADPMAQSRFGMTCDLREMFERRFGTAPNYNIYYVLGHYHEWGNFFNLSFVEEDGTERTIMEIDTRAGDALGRTIDPPMSSQGAAGLRITCGYDNTTDRVLTWGNGGFEMCQFLAYTDANLKIAGFTEAESILQGQDAEDRFIYETECDDNLFGL